MHLTRDVGLATGARSLEGRRDHAGRVGLLLLLHQLFTGDLKGDGKADLGGLLYNDHESVSDYTRHHRITE